jgi:hypothetical protein
VVVVVLVLVLVGDDVLLFLVDVLLVLDGVVVC